MNPWYRTYTQGKPSYVIFRHGTQFFRGCYSRDAWTAHATRYLIGFDFQKTLHSRDVFLTLSRRFVRLGFRLNCARNGLLTQCASNIREELGTKKENISAMKRLLKIKTYQMTRRVGCPRIAGVTYASSEELGTMSKNNVRGITLGIRSILGFTLLPS